jgi:tRNA pseudouridine13 synthase
MSCLISGCSRATSLSSRSGSFVLRRRFVSHFTNLRPLACARRDVEADSPSTIERAISTLRTRGFINYYGMQRFGTAPVPTHAIGLALLRSDWALAVHLILRVRDGEGEDVAHARQVYHEGKLEEAVRLMPRRAVAERASELTLLWSWTKDWLTFLGIPVLEAYQRGNKNDHLAALSRVSAALARRSRPSNPPR